MDDLQMLLFRQHGVISRRQALQWLTHHAIRHRLATGRWLQAHRGGYVTTGAGELDLHQRRTVASLVAGSGRLAPLGGASALQLLGLRGFAGSVVDAAQWAQSDQCAAGLVAAAFQQRLVTLAEVADAAARQPKARRRSSALEAAGWRP